jgi:hypothetical protein
LSVLAFDAPALPRLESSDDSIEAIEEPVDEAPHWPVILLASYASAVTLALFWLILTGRVRGRDVPAPATIPTDSRPDLAHRDDRSKALKVPEDRLTSMGQPLRVGSLEITPLGLKVGRVTLEHVSSGDEPRTRATRDGGKGVLRLRVRLRNLSKDATFAPLDATFVREPDRGLPDSYLETGRGEFIDAYPLAAQSEWSIVGQTFPQLGPGQSAETVVVSAPDAIERVADPMTWRLRFRVGPDRTEAIGLRFARHEIEREGN